MEKFISNKTFDQLTDKLIDFMNMLNEVKGITELNPRILAILKEYGKPADGSDEEILLRYETWYDKLDEFAIKKDKVIEKCQNIINKIQDISQQMQNLLNTFDSKEKIDEIINKQIILNDRIKVTLNDLVDKIIEKKTILHKNKMKQLDNTMKKHCDTIEATYAKDKEILENIVPSINKLKEWSDKQKCSVIFDSKLDGDGENNGFMNKVMNKQNLYFISFDNQNNVFGGYADNNINITDGSRTNPNAFTFSLIRNGNLENMKYNIKKEQENCAFSFYYNHILYAFGFYYSNNRHKDIYHDICVNKNGSIICYPHSYEYNGEKNHLLTIITLEQKEH